MAEPEGPTETGSGLTIPELPAGYSSAALPAYPLISTHIIFTENTAGLLFTAGLYDNFANQEVNPSPHLDLNKKGKLTRKVSKIVDAIIKNYGKEMNKEHEQT